LSATSRGGATIPESKKVREEDTTSVVDTADDDAGELCDTAWLGRPSGRLSLVVFLAVGDGSEEAFGGHGSV
jgi:hypothetical protein